MKYTLILLVPIFLFSDTSFITPMEYASQLYKNPRGIGCEHCHGINGEGKIVARYIDKKKKKIFSGPVINNLDFYVFNKALNKRKRGMPRYFLINSEIKALYFYLQEQKERKNDK
ncbi:MAG: hypothetical protein COA33_007305 [Fluviicola sp.]|nr:hypothetical protein [Fluviicola sp.]